MPSPNIVTQAQWLQARKALLLEEKAFTRARDALTEQRQALPSYEVDACYRFDDGKRQWTLLELFGDCRQLIVYHFMYGPDWQAGCPSCSFWADNFNGIETHLRHRDTQLLAISRTDIKHINAYKQRMGWAFPWLSSLGSTFNEDFQVSFPEHQAGEPVDYNYRKTTFPSEEAPGISVFYRTEDGRVLHSYSCYARGLDMLNGAYHYLDLTPLGRHEKDLPYTMAWLKRHDEYAR